MLINPEDIEKDEDKTWQNKTMTSKMTIKIKIEEYINSFSIHGLTRVFVGNRKESIFWSVILMIMTIFAAISIHKLVAEYHQYDCYTEMREKLTKEQVFTSITICNHEKLEDVSQSYCGRRYWQHGDMSKSSDWEKVEQRKAEFREVKEGPWSNGAFNISQCKSLPSRTNCLNKKLFKATSILEDSCVTFNYNENLKDSSVHISILKKESFTHENNNLILTIHDANVYDAPYVAKLYQLRLQ